MSSRFKLGKYGGDRRSEEAQNQDDVVILKPARHSAAYLLARLERDHHAIAQRYLAGEFKSVRQAAIVASIITPKTIVGTFAGDICLPRNE